MSYIYRKNENNRLEKQFAFDKSRNYELECIPLKKANRILDIGCGTGTFTNRLKEMFPESETYGLDMRNEAIIQASKNFPYIKFQQGQAEDLPFEDDYFDLVTARLLFQHNNKLNIILMEIKRVLRSEGVILIIDVDEDTYIRYPELPTIVQRLYNIKRKIQEENGGDRGIGKKLFNLLQESNFKNINIKIIPSIWSDLSDKDMRKVIDLQKDLFIQIEKEIISREFMDRIEFKDALSELENYFLSNIFSVNFKFIASATK